MRRITKNCRRLGRRRRFYECVVSFLFFYFFFVFKQKLAKAAKERTEVAKMTIEEAATKVEGKYRVRKHSSWLEEMRPEGYKTGKERMVTQVRENNSGFEVELF
jgi:hypothetical protein